MERVRERAFTNERLRASRPEAFSREIRGANKFDRFIFDWMIIKRELIVYVI